MMQVESKTNKRLTPSEIPQNTGQKEALVKLKRGRPSKYGMVDPVSVASIIGKLGGTDKELSAALGISEASFNSWKKEHADLLESLKKSKEYADSQVEKSLFQRAIGYSHPDVDIRTVSIGNGCSQIVQTPTVKHYPPDTTACIYWTKNRRPDLWRDAQRHEHIGADGGAIQIEHASADDLKAELLKLGAIDSAGRLMPARNLIYDKNITHPN